MSLMGTEPGLDRFIDGLENLPPSPAIIVQLVSLLREPDRDIDQLLELISRDPSLTVEILKRCNSAFFAGDQPATDIFEATFRLGFYEVYRMATALLGSQAIRWPAAKEGLPLEAAWAHSALTAVVAAVVAQEVEENEAVAFTAGLLHDVGKVVLACAAGAGYAQIYQAEAEQLSGAEQARFGFTHSDVGARLLGRWGLPVEIVAPVQFHHTPEEAGSFGRLASILNLADIIAKVLSQAAGSEKQVCLQDAFSYRTLEMTPDRVSAITTRAQEQSRKVREVFQLRA